MSKITFFLLLTILGLLGNIINIEMFFGVNQIFGSAFVLVAAWYFGPTLGLLCAVIVHSYTVHLWGHPYAMISFVLEAYVVGLLLKYKFKNIFIADIIYWLVFGIALVFIFYGEIMGVSQTQVNLIALKQFTNGILNALLANLLRLFVIKYYNEENRVINLREIIFSIMISIVSFALYFSAIVSTKQVFKNMEETIIYELTDLSSNIQKELKTFINSTVVQSVEKQDFSIQSLDKCVDYNTVKVNDKSLQINFKHENFCAYKVINLSTFRNFLKEQTYQNDLNTLLVKDNKVLLSSNNQLNLNLQDSRKIYISENIYQNLPGEDLPKIIKWKNSNYIYEISCKNFPNHNILIAKSFSNSIDSLQQIYIFTFIVLILIILFSTLIVQYSSKVILEPLEILKNNTKNLPYKIISKEEVFWPKTNIKELMSLSNNFDNLTNSLKSIFDENEMRYQNLFNSSNDLILSVDLANKKILDMNTKAKSILGDKILNSNIEIIFQDTDKYEDLKFDTYDEIFYLNDKENNRFPTTINRLFLKLGNKNLNILIIKDVKVQIKAKEQLKLINKVFETTEEGIVITDSNFNIIDVNNGYMKITNYSLEQVVNQDLREVHSNWNNSSKNTNIWARTQSDGRWEGEIFDIRDNGDFYVKWLNLYKLKDDSGDTQNYVGIFTDITEKKQNEIKINQLAYYDTLTNLPNRALFEDRITHSIEKAKRYKNSIALMFIDLDNFKVVNDSMGHKAGDELLQKVTDRIKNVIRNSDTLSRLGGDEFTLIIEDVEDKSVIASIAKKIISSLKEPFVIEEKIVYTGSSIGICVYPDDASTISEMMQNADTAMYIVKENGKNNFKFYNEKMNQYAQEQMKITSELKKALENNELELHYQAQKCVQTDKIVGAEALVRWNKGDNRFISPDIFIPIAEKSSLMQDVENFVLNESARQQKKWRDEGLDIILSVNISDVQFKKDDFVDSVCNIFYSHRVDFKTICLELTERIVMDSETSFTKIKKLKNRGFSVALDDFGTGQSSLSYLKKYDIDKLKIDKSFVNDIPDDSQSNSIVHAIISLAKAMDMQVIAEGVEIQEQFDKLKELDCFMYQGWYFTKALSEKDFVNLYNRHKIKLS